MSPIIPICNKCTIYHRQNYHRLNDQFQTVRCFYGVHFLFFNYFKSWSRLETKICNILYLSLLVFLLCLVWVVLSQGKVDTNRVVNYIALQSFQRGALNFTDISLHLPCLGLEANLTQYVCQKISSSLFKIEECLEHLHETTNYNETLLPNWIHLDWFTNL